MGGMDLVQANMFAPQDLMLILLLALVCFGGKKLPEIGRSLGKAMRELQRASDAWHQPASGERPQVAQLGPAPQAPGAHAPSSAPPMEAQRHEPEVPEPGTRVYAPLDERHGRVARGEGGPAAGARRLRAPRSPAWAATGG